MAELLLVFLAGLAGSMHCLGMCGGFACGLGADVRGRGATLARHLIYNAGRVSSYCFLGAVAGQIGWLLVGPGGAAAGGEAGAAQQVLALLSGGLMGVVGLQFLGWLPHPRGAAIGAVGQLVARALRALVQAPGPAAPLALGVLNGLLPCPLVYAFVAQAVACGTASRGWQIMAAFGLATFPAMLAMGGVGLWVWRRAPANTITLTRRSSSLQWSWRAQGVRLAGAFILLLGAITFARGLWVH